MRSGFSGVLLLTFLALVVGAEVKLGTVQTAGISPPPPAQAPPRRLALPAFELPPLATFSETVERPLFSATRRPPEPAPAPAPAAPVPVASAAPAVGPFVLSAIIIDSEQRVVLLRDPKSGKITRLSEGETVAGWKLERIEAEQVTLRSGTQRREVELRRFEPAPAPKPAPAVKRRRARTRDLARALGNRASARSLPQRRPPQRAPRRQQPRPEESCGLSRC